MAEGLRLWVLPDPGVGGISAMDMQLLGVGVAFYAAAVSVPSVVSYVDDNIYSNWYPLVSGSVMYPFIPKEKLDVDLRNKILKDDQEILELFTIIIGGLK